MPAPDRASIGRKRFPAYLHTASNPQRCGRGRGLGGRGAHELGEEHDGEEAKKLMDEVD